VTAVGGVRGEREATSFSHETGLWRRHADVDVLLGGAAGRSQSRTC
jgi:hypothetical protein